jgi:hypothetical protein
VTFEEFKTEMDQFWEETNQEALELKDSYRALDRLHSLYTALDDHERGLADQVLCEWALSDHEGKRFDAMALISDFDIKRAIPALERLARRLEKSREPGAPFERDKAKRIIAQLSNGDPSRSS